MITPWLLIYVGDYWMYIRLRLILWTYVQVSSDSLWAQVTSLYVKSVNLCSSTMSVKTKGCIDWETHLYDVYMCQTRKDTYVWLCLQNQDCKLTLFKWAAMSYKVFAHNLEFNGN